MVMIGLKPHILKECAISGELVTYFSDNLEEQRAMQNFKNGGHTPGTRNLHDSRSQSPQTVVDTGCSNVQESSM